MPDQIVPITQLDQTGVILDTPPVSLPPNAFTNARNVRFKDGAVRKMEGEVDIFAGISDFFRIQTSRSAGTTEPVFRYAELQYVAWWPSPNQTIRDAGYYVFVVEDVELDNTVHRVFAMQPGASVSIDTSNPTLRNATFAGIAEISARIPNPDFNPDNEVGPENLETIPGPGYSSQSTWQHTLFNGGFTFIINNGVEKPQYITDPEGNVDITQLSLADLPGWDSYQVNELLLRDDFTETSSSVFDTGQERAAGVTQYIVTRVRGNDTDILAETPTGGTPSMDQYTVTTEGGLDVITFFTNDEDTNENTLQIGDRVQVNFQSVNEVEVRSAIVRSFGDFLVAGNLVETVADPDNPNGDPIIVRRLTGVVRSSDVAQPGSIPANWNPFAAGVSTADEFTIADTGTVQDMVPLQGNMYLYTNSSISVMRLTGNVQVPLAVQPVTDQYGALTTNSVLEYDGKHFVIGSNDIYLFGGHPGSIQSISDTKVRRTFFERVNPINRNTANLFTLRYAARDEIWVCFPTVDSTRGESDEAYIWNYRSGTWTIRTLTSVVSGDIAPVPGGGVPSAILSLTGSSGTNDIIKIGTQEVQTIGVMRDASVGHNETTRLERQTFATQRSLNSIARPAIQTNAEELAQIVIGAEVFPGPNPRLQRVEITNPNQSFTYIENGNDAVDNGGARLEATFTDTRRAPGTADVTQTFAITANQLFTPSELLEDATTLTGTGTTADAGNRADSRFSVATNSIGETSQQFSGSDNSNPASTLVTTSRAFDNFVTNTNSNGTDVDITTAPGGSFGYGGGASGTATAQATFDTGGANNGSVTANLTVVNTMTSVQTPGQTVTFIGGNTERRPTARIIYPTVPSGMSIVVAGQTIAGGTMLSPLQTAQLIGDPNSSTTNLVSYFANPRGSPRPNVRGEYFVSEPGTGRVQTSPFRGAISFIQANPNASATTGHSITGWLGFNRFTGLVSGGTNRFSGCWYRGTSTNAGFGRYVGNQRVSIDGDTGQATSRSRVIWSFGEPIPNVNDFTSLNTITVGNVTASVPTVVQTVTLNSVTNNTNGTITFDWAGANVTVPAGQTVNPGTVAQGTNQAWSFRGTGVGTTFTNNSLYSIADFNPNGDGSIGTLGSTGSAGDTTTIPVVNATTWSGNTARITVVNNNVVNTGDASRLMGRDGRIDFVTTSDTNRQINPGGTSVTLRDHNNDWSFSGIRNIMLSQTQVVLTRTQGVPINNARFSVNPLTTGLTDATDDLTLLNRNGVISLIFPADSINPNFTWSVTGRAQPATGETRQYDPITSQEFLNRAADFINDGNVPEINLSEWTVGTRDADNNVVGLTFNSIFAGQRDFSNVRFTTHGRGTTIANRLITDVNQVQGVGQVIDPALQDTVAYELRNPGIPLTVTYDLPRDTNPNDNVPSNRTIEEGFVAALTGNATFNQYYRIVDDNTDPAIGAGRFNLIARALPGELIDGGPLRFPTTPTVISAINLEHGGIPALTVQIVPGVSPDVAPLAVTIESGHTRYDPITGMRLDTTFINDPLPAEREHTLIISGQYAAGDDTTMNADGVEAGLADTLRLNEQFRQFFRTDNDFMDQWTLNDEDERMENPTQLRLTSIATEDLFNRVTTNRAVGDTDAFAPYFNFDVTQAGLGNRLGDDLTDDEGYPLIRLTAPSSEQREGADNFVDIRLDPPPGVTTALTSIDITDRLIRGFSYGSEAEGNLWRVDTTVDTSLTGTGQTSDTRNVKLVKAIEGNVDGEWTVTILNYGTNGNTLSGDDDPGDLAIGGQRLIGRLNPSDFNLVNTTGIINLTDNVRAVANMTGDNLDFRGTRTERSQPTKMIVEISNDDVVGNVQYIPFEFGGSAGYDPATQLPAQPATRLSNLEMLERIESGIRIANRRIDPTINGNALTILPNQYSGLASFVLNIGINNDEDGVARYNLLADRNNMVMNEDGTPAFPPIPLLLTADDPDNDNGGIQSTVLASTTPFTNRTQFDARNNTAIPNFTDRGVDSTTANFDRSINTQFDPLRPWPTTQVNLNQEYPIFATSILNLDDASLEQHFRGADIGFLNLDMPYESFVERIEMAITPEFDTEQIQSLALWGDGGNIVTFGDPLRQAVLSIKMYGTNAPGETQGVFNNEGQRTTGNEFRIGEDYKIDMRVHGRFLNLLITDYMFADENSMRVPNDANQADDENVVGSPLRGISWNISGMQADIVKGGRR